MTIPPLPEFPVLPAKNEHRALWVRWATEYGAECARKEREACAKLCDDMVLYTGFDCAAAIRSQPEVKP